ncbi:MAG: class I SAM-dependent methyltransferase [Candidatus Omnitrophica bacterium]|nr:class I SAM-dependent methyltransferase [Candidatus Omnitrophota bacterium]
MRGLLTRGPSALSWQVRYTLNQVQGFERVLNLHGFSLRHFRSILEFGCGFARLTEPMANLAPQAEIHGCDVSPRDLRRARRRCPRGRFIVNQVTPPLPYSNAQFDFIFSYSVFTHLTEENHRGWLRELSRILAPGGVMVHTTHSYRALRQMGLFSPQSLAKYRLGGAVEEFIVSRKGYHYALWEPSQPEYGLSILSKEYVLENWPRVSGLALVDYVEDAVQAFPEGCQDMVLLQKRNG